MTRSQQRAGEAYSPRSPFPTSTSRTISSLRVLTPYLPPRLGHPPFNRQSHSSITPLEKWLLYLCPDLRNQIPRTNNQTSCSTRLTRTSKGRRILWVCRTPTCRDMCLQQASTRTLPVTRKNHSHPSLELVGEVCEKNSVHLVRSDIARVVTIYCGSATHSSRQIAWWSSSSIFIIILRDLISCVHLGQ